jgi:hypothetical protein
MFDDKFIGPFYCVYFSFLATNQPNGNDHEAGSIKSVTTGNILDIMTDISTVNVKKLPNEV